MPYTKLIYHIIFSTKQRKRVLFKENRPKLFKYIWGILQKKRCFLYRINGIEDHIHILLSIPASISISDLVKSIKVGSNIWIKEENIFPLFESWQVSYSAFTVSEFDKDRLINYIKNQEIHHQTENFEAELKRLLLEHNVSFEEKYLF